MKEIEVFVNELLGNDFFSFEIEELKQEITSHIKEQVRELKELGLSENEAFIIAKERFADHNLRDEYQQLKSEIKSEANKEKKTLNNIIVIGCSTGGPRALHQIIPTLSKEINACILIVQHMPRGSYTKSLAEHLNSISHLEVVEAKTGTILEDGKVIIAKGGFHMKVKKMGVHYEIENAEKGEKTSTHTPSVDETLMSLKEVEIPLYISILTGMGKDGLQGVQELALVKKPKIIAQSEKTSVIYGMPKHIKENGLADYILDLQEIMPLLENLIKKKNVLKELKGKEQTVLVAFQSLFKRSVIKNILEGINQKTIVKVVLQEEELFQEIKAKNYDLIITDYKIETLINTKKYIYLSSEQENEEYEQVKEKIMAHYGGENE